MLGCLAESGYGIAEELSDATIAVINTCSFIGSAREESIEAILEVADLREKGNLKSLVVAGCLPQRYGKELAKELPEVDIFIGTSAFRGIADILDQANSETNRGIYVESGSTHLYDDRTPRILLGAGHSAYIKIAEGCDRVCAFCAIPGIRGSFQSRTLESVVKEAEQLGKSGVRELNLVAQDSTSWGKDLTSIPGKGRPKLHELLHALDRVSSVDWIRLLYVYPSAITNELIEILSSGQRVLPYVDVPLQHGSDKILRSMRRGTNADLQRRLVNKLRASINGLTLRTTVIVGFPGETDADYDELVSFVKEMQFDRLGVFRYSDEENTKAIELSKKVPRKISRERYKNLIKVQREIMKEKQTDQIGKEDQVLLDSLINPSLGIGRLSSQAPEIDGVVHVTGPSLKIGQFASVRITGVNEIDLRAEVI
ncbi:30S ribosomal protein S12 methylthiotransferase RimO [Myxococcota bacterium]|nr:30S ribosomal protein S12 methylthiotransferase RimO [Myxococcota bacterium]